MIKDSEDASKRGLSTGSSPPYLRKREFRFINPQTTFPVYFTEDGIYVFQRKPKGRFGLWLSLCVIGMIVTPPFAISAVMYNAPPNADSLAVGYIAVIISVLAWGIPALALTVREWGKAKKERLSKSASMDEWNQSPKFRSKFHAWSDVSKIRMREDDNHLDFFVGHGLREIFMMVRFDDNSNALMEDVKALLEEKIGNRLKFKPLRK